MTEQLFFFSMRIKVSLAISFQTVQPPDPYDEEKGEARTGSSATTPGSVTTPCDSRLPPRPPDPLSNRRCKQGANTSPQDEIETYFTNMADYFLTALMEGKTQVGVALDYSLLSFINCNFVKSLLYEFNPV